MAFGAVQRAQSDAFGSKIWWRRPPPTPAINCFRSGASKRPAIQPKMRNRNMSMSAVNMALIALVALSLAACSTTGERPGGAGAGADKVAKL